MAVRSTDHRCPPSGVLLVLFLAASIASVSRADVAADTKECQDQLLQLQPCLPYVSKQGPKRTPDCCASMKEVLGKSLRCLCILIKDKDEPVVKKFNIDLDRALTIPQVCGINASTSDCPKLLNLAPDSPEAKLFKDVDGKLHGNGTAGSTTPSTPGSATATSTPSSSGAVHRHYYPGIGGLLGWLGSGLWVYTSVAALLLAILNVHGA